MNRVKLDSDSCEFSCPGCGQVHFLPIVPGPHASWAFSGDATYPTLSPSIAAQGMLAEFGDDGEWTGKWILDGSGNTIPYVCHSFLRNGLLEFLSDCTHTLAGQTVELPARYLA